MNSRTAIGVIPARLSSSRLPGKLLLNETGKPLLQHTWEAACQSETLDAVVIAAEDQTIVDQCRGFGADCVITGSHPSGTDRVAEAIRNRSSEQAIGGQTIVVNIQGDEPELEPDHIDRLVRMLVDDPSAEMATLATPIRSREQRDDNSCVKVVRDRNGRALYFSRATIPAVRDGDPDSHLTADPPTWLLHVGIYAFRQDFLLHLTSTPPCKLEQLEKLEQLRALDLGATIHVGLVDHPAIGIDTPEDYQQFVKRWRNSNA